MFPNQTITGYKINIAQNLSNNFIKMEWNRMNILQRLPVTELHATVTGIQILP
jgi:hypothetical protein